MLYGIEQALRGLGLNSETVAAGAFVVILGLMGIFFPELFAGYGVSPKIQAAVSLGFVTGGIFSIIYGLIAKPKKKKQLKICGNCANFQSQACLQGQNQFNAMPCEEFVQKQVV